MTVDYVKISSTEDQPPTVITPVIVSAIGIAIVIARKF